MSIGHPKKVTQRGDPLFPHPTWWKHLHPSGIAPPPWQPSIWPALKIISKLVPNNCFGDLRRLGGTCIISAQLYGCLILHIAFAVLFAAASQLTPLVKDRNHFVCAPLQCAMHKPQAISHKPSQKIVTRLNKTETISILRSHLGLLPGIIQAPMCLAALSTGVLNMGIGIREIAFFWKSTGLEQL